MIALFYQDLPRARSWQALVLYRLVADKSRRRARRQAKDLFVSTIQADQAVRSRRKNSPAAAGRANKGESYVGVWRQGKS